MSFEGFHLKFGRIDVLWKAFLSKEKLKESVS